MKKVIPVFLLVALSLSVLTPLPVQAAMFPDVPKNFWAYDYIDLMSKAGWITGKPDGKFYPNEPITRGQVALILYTFARKSFDFLIEDYYKLYPEMPLSEEDKIWRDFPANFADVNPDTKLGRSVGLLAHYNIVNGYPDGTFRPNEPLTRGQMAVILSRYYWGSEEANRRARMYQNESLPFKDAIPSAQRGYIAQVYEKGWMGGTSKTTFGAEKKVTRAQAAVILHNLFYKTTDRLFWKNGAMSAAYYY